MLFPTDNSRKAGLTGVERMSTSAQYGFEAELELANHVQRALLPKPNCCIDGWEIAFSYEAAHHVSGDYVDLIEVRPGEFCFILGDVSGKGIAAALLMAHLHATLRMLLLSGASLDQVVQQTSSTFCQSSLPAQFVTLVIGKASVNGSVELINAGHTPVLFAHEGKTAALPATEVPLGLFCDLDGVASSTIVTLTAVKGDMLLLYSDGVTETSDVEGAEYGVERLGDLLARTAHHGPQQAIEAVLKDLNSFSGDSALSDDRSLLALRFYGMRQM